jgi:hypothetical protein
VGRGDIAADELDAAVADAIELGAKLAEFPQQERARTH